MRSDFNISHKANRVLNVILLAFMLIFIRVWYLSIIQRDEHVQKALRPQRKTVIDKVERATIRDRFNIPLATNKIQLNASVRYADLRQIPSGVWKKDSSGKKYREPVRNNYIKSLSEMLGNTLSMDPILIEDTIHAKASLFPHTPFVIKEDLTEEEFYKLKFLEKDWIGMEAQKSSKRIYPLGKVGCDVIGYLGAISQNEYVKIAQEIKTLQEYIDKRDKGELALLPKGFNDPIEVRTRLKELSEKAYTINDLVGKTGIESVYEETLRGLHGKKSYEIDPKGNCIRELASSKKSTSGQRLVLSISSELQEFAEGLLAHNESVRHTRDPRRMIGVARPWILGGAIVAMDPNTGEVLALASYPRFDPNDFIPAQMIEKKKQKQSSILQWLENESFVAEIWDGKRPLERERFSLQDSKFYKETQALTWDVYLQTILPPSSSALKAIRQIETVGTGYNLINCMQKIIELSESSDIRAVLDVLYSDPSYVAVRKTILAEQREFIKAKQSENKEQIRSFKSYLDRYLAEIKYNDDKLLVLDLLRLILPKNLHEKETFSALKDYPLSYMHEISQNISCLKSQLYEELQKPFHDHDFKEWRQIHFKEFLKQKREEEKAQKKYVRPYTEYLEKIENTLFKEFFDHNCAFFISTLIETNVRKSTDHQKMQPYVDHLFKLKEEKKISFKILTQLNTALKGLSPSASLAYLESNPSFSQKTDPLWGKYRMLRNTSGQQQLKHLAGAFYPLAGFGHGRSQAFRQAAAQGSVFKLVVAYEALREKYLYLRENHMSLSELNPLTLVDLLRPEKAGTNQQILGYTLEGDPIKRFYKGGKLPRSHPNIGKIDVRGALEQSSNLYFSYLAAEYIQDPSCLDTAARNMGYGIKTGIDLPGEISGNIPNDIYDNKTGLYSFAIGQHSLVVTPLQTSVMLSSIANHGKVFKPKIVRLTAGKKMKEEGLRSTNDNFPFQEQLSLVGINFPLFTEALDAKQEDLVNFIPTTVKHEIFLPEEVRTMLLEGMEQVVNAPKGTARPNVIRALWSHPKIMKDYIDLRYQLVGKTGTAETLYKQWIDAESHAEISNNIWFGGISFHPDESGKADWQKPELAVAVYLKFSDTGGKEAAPLAAQVVAKWREICSKHGNDTFLKDSELSD